MTLNTKIQTSSGLTKPNTSTLTLCDLLHKIRYGNGVSETIRLCREAYIKDGKDAMSKIKDTLPLYCISANFINNTGKKFDDVESATNLLYIDLDYKDNHDVADGLWNFIIKNEYVLSAYRSVSGYGLTVIVKSENIDKENYTEVVRRFVSEQLREYEFLFDIKTVNINRFVFMTEDSNLFLNEGCSTFQNSAKIGCNHANILIQDIRYINYNRSYHGCTFLKLEKQLEFYNSDCVYLEEGLMFYEVYFPFVKNGTPKKVPSGYRNSTMSQIANNLVLLNADADINDVYEFMQYANGRICLPPLPEIEVRLIVDKKIRSLRKGVLKPIGEKIKYYWVNPMANSKKSAYMDRMKSVSVDKLSEFFNGISDYEIKITTEFIFSMIGLSVRTIKYKLTPEQKQLIKQHNLKIKNGNQI